MTSTGAGNIASIRVIEVTQATEGSPQRVSPRAGALRISGRSCDRVHCDNGVTGLSKAIGGDRKRAHVRDDRAIRAVPILHGNNATRDPHESIAGCAMLHRSKEDVPTGRSTRRTVLVREPSSQAPIRIQAVEQGEQLHTEREGEVFRS